MVETITWLLKRPWKNSSCKNSLYLFNATSCPCKSATICIDPRSSRVIADHGFIIHCIRATWTKMKLFMGQLLSRHWFFKELLAPWKRYKYKSYALDPIFFASLPLWIYDHNCFGISSNVIEFSFGGSSSISDIPSAGFEWWL